MNHEHSDDLPQMVISTPNTITFPPGNIYHPKELTPGELRDLVGPHAVITSYEGLSHGPGLQSWEAANGSLIDAQTARPYAEWDDTLVTRVTSVTVDDFVFSENELDSSPDLIVVARKGASAV